MSKRKYIYEHKVSSQIFKSRSKRELSEIIEESNFSKDIIEIYIHASPDDFYNDTVTIKFSCYVEDYEGSRASEIDALTEIAYVSNNFKNMVSRNARRKI